MVVYGVEGLVSNVPSSVFDHVFRVVDGKMVLQTDLDVNNHLLLKPKLGGDLDLNYKRFHSGGLDSFRASVTGMIMETALDLGGFSIYQPKLSDDLDLDGNYVKSGRTILFDGINGELTMQSDVNMNTFLLKEPKLGGNLNWNNKAVYKNDIPLFGYSLGAIRGE